MLNISPIAEPAGAFSRRDWRRVAPTWLVSLVAHLAAALLLITGLYSSPAETPGEGERRAGIVLAQPAAGRVDYLGESDDLLSEQSESTSAAAPSSSAAADRESRGLPGEQELPPLADIALPGRPEIGGGLEGVVVAPSISGRRMRGFIPAGDDAEFLAEELARKRDAGPQGEPARLSIFGTSPASGHRFVFVIDRSKSMGAGGLGVLSAAQKQLAAALAQLEPRHSFQVIAYNQEPHYIDRRRLLEATEENKRLVQDFFDRLAAFGATNHDLALLAALRLEPDVIFFLTDGGDPYLTDGQLELIRRRNQKRAAIQCLQFGFGPARGENGFMQRLAEENRGGYSYIDMAHPG